MTAERTARLAALRNRIGNFDRPHDQAEVSEAQKRLWFVHQTDPTGIALNVGIGCVVDGFIDRDRLVRALNAVVERHLSLRTRFVADDEGQVQAVADLAATCPVIDMNAGGKREQESEAVLRIPFDVANAHLIRVGIEAVGGKVRYFVVAVHHLVWDDASWEPFFGALTSAFDGSPTSLNVPAPSALTGSEADGDYWKQALRGSRAGLGMPPVEACANAAIELSLPSDLDLAAIARNYEASPFALLATALRAAVDTRPSPLVVAAPVECRDHPEFRDAIGYFGNTLALPLPGVGGFTARDAVQQTFQVLLDALEHKYCDFGRQIRCAGKAGTQIDVGITVEGADFQVNIGDAAVEVIPVRSGMSQFPVMLLARVQHGRWTIRLEYIPQAISAAVATTITEQVADYLAALADPAFRFEAPPSAAAVDTDDGRLTAVDHIATHVEQTPDAIAVRVGAFTLTYRQLWLAAGALAHRLRQEGAGPERVVAVIMDRSLSASVSMLGVLRSGSALAELNPSLPSARIGTLLNSAQAHIAVVDDANYDQHLNALADRALIVRPELWQGVAESELPRPHPDSMAAIFHTSGSTGQPKPVALTHRSLGAHVEWFLPTQFDGDRPRWLQTSSPGFDISVGEVLCTWSVGGEVIVADSGVERDPDAFVTAVCSSGANIVHAVPTMLEHVLSAAHRQELATFGAIRWIPVGGEPFPGGLADRFRRTFPQVSLSNFYGPTETTVSVTGTRICGEQGDRVIGIGEPKTDSELFVLDAALEEVPHSDAGELYVAGEAVARGYYGRPGETAARFVAAPGGHRRYRTGDLVRRTDHGLEFVGRVDHQVKIRGVRIEPEEIEAALLDDPVVQQAVITVKNQVIHGFVVVQDYSSDDLGEKIRADLLARLPSAMVPATITVLEQLPSTPHGKVDRRALTKNQVNAGPVADAIADVFQQVLGVRAVDPADSFFALGGHSLLIAAVIAALRDQYGYHVDVRDIFAHPTPGSLARHIRVVDADAEVVAHTRPERPPLTLAQRRIWIIDQMSRPSATYNVPVVLDIRGAVDTERLCRAVDAVIARHAALRTKYPEVDGNAWQEVSESGPQCQVRVVPDDELDQQVQACCTRVFHLTDEVPVAVTLLSSASDRHRLVFVIHHIACDDESGRILAQDVMDLYCGIEPARQVVGPVDVALTATTVISEGAQQFWSSASRGLTADTVIGNDRARPPRGSAQYETGGVVLFHVPDDVAHSVRQAAADEGATPFLVLQAALACFLHGRGVGTDIAFGTPFSTRPADDRSIGLYINIVLIRNDLSGAPSFRTVVARARDHAAAAYQHAHASFEWVLSASGASRTGPMHPLFQQIVQLRPQSPAPRTHDGVTWTPIATNTDTAKYDLAWDFEIAADGYRGELVYRTAMFDQTTAQRLANDLTNYLKSVLAQPDCPIESVNEGNMNHPSPLEALLAIDSVTDVVIVDHRVGDLAVPIAYVAAPRDPRLTADEQAREFRGVAVAHAPTITIPATVVLVDLLPRTEFGEVDNAALPVPARVTTGLVDPPQGESERTLAEIFGDVLQLDELGRHDNFFALGGDSIMAIQIASRARAHGIAVSAQLIFEGACIAAVVEAMASEPPPEDQQPATPAAPLSASGLDAETLMSLLGENTEGRRAP